MALKVIWLGAGCLGDVCEPERLTHTYADVIRARLMAVACGYEDSDDLDHLRRDPAFKMVSSRPTKDLTKAVFRSVAATLREEN